MYYIRDEVPFRESDRNDQYQIINCFRFWVIVKEEECS